MTLITAEYTVSACRFFGWTDIEGQILFNSNIFMFHSGRNTVSKYLQGADLIGG